METIAKYRLAALLVAAALLVFASFNGKHADPSATGAVAAVGAPAAP